MDKKGKLKFCELCRQSVQDEVKYGKFMQKGNISVHYYCLLLSSNLVQNGEENEGFLGFLPNDIIREAKRVKTQNCYYCRKNYANVACCAPKCRRTFHLSCGIESGVISHFTDTYQSFCPRDVKWDNTTKPSEEEICIVCYEKLGPYNKYFMILSPCCKTGWFHRWCLASFALSAGYFFKCPKCNDTDTFREQVVRKGIFIPDQDAAWELESDAFAELLERPNECAANECYCPNGRSFNESNYNLLICHTCGSKAIHSKCMDENSTIFTCKDCAEILKNRNLDVGQIPEDRYEIEQINRNENDDEDVDILNNSDNESVSNKVEELNVESDDCNMKLQVIRNKIKRNRFRIDSDGDVEKSIKNNDELISKQSELCSKNDDKTDNNNENFLPEKEKISIRENGTANNNLVVLSNRSPSVSSSESINRAFKSRRKKKKRTRKLSTSSSISTSSSSFDLPLQHRVFRMISSSCESSYRSNSEECEISKISAMKANNVKDKYGSLQAMESSSTSSSHDEKKTAQTDSKRCSSLGYVSDNLPSSSENLKPSGTCYEYDNYGKENKSVKRRRSNMDECNDEYSISQHRKQNSNNVKIGVNIKRRLRKRTETKKVPYQLRQRSSSISYEMSDDGLGFCKLIKNWSVIFSPPKHGTSSRRKKSQKFKRKISGTDTLAAGQTSIDSYFKRCQTASSSF